MTKLINQRFKVTFYTFNEMTDMAIWLNTLDKSHKHINI